MVGTGLLVSTGLEPAQLVAQLLSCAGSCLDHFIVVIGELIRRR